MLMVVSFHCWQAHCWDCTAGGDHKHTFYEKWAAIMGLGHFFGAYFIFDHAAHLVCQIVCIYGANVGPVNRMPAMSFCFKHKCYGRRWTNIALHKHFATFQNWTALHSFLHEVKLTMCHFWYKFEQITKSK